MAETWSFASTGKLEDNPTCPFCKNYMKFESMNSEGLITENLWLCLNQKCRSKSMLTLSFQSL